MRTRLALACAASALLALGGVSKAGAAPSEASVADHVAAATRAAGNDMPALLALCKAPPAAKPPQADIEKGLASLMALPAPPPGKAFDNLYFVGAKWVSAWALTTSDGIILIDALNNEAEASTLIDGGLRKIGLDPARIKIVIVTHGHGDHYGGARYLVDKYHPKVVMSDIDWGMLESGKFDFDMPAWGRPPQRDISAKDGDKITLGDTTVTLTLTPGHTWGTLSPVFDVKEGGRTHRVLLWGGTAFNFGKDIPRLDAYVASTERTAALAKQQGIDVLISNHSDYDAAIAKLDKLRADPALQPNPFVIGQDAVQRALTVMDDCAQAARDRFQLP
jgi:metallo-beta-lactamase class B